MSDIKVCPFCGSDPVEIIDQVDGEPCEYLFMCAACLVRTSGMRIREAATDKWNTRTRPEHPDEGELSEMWAKWNMNSLPFQKETLTTAGMAVAFAAEVLKNLGGV